MLEYQVRRLENSMKHRITYLRKNDDGFDPSQLSVGKNDIHIRALHSAKEHRVTFGFDELSTGVCTRQAASFAQC